MVENPLREIAEQLVRPIYKPLLEQGLKPIAGPKASGGDEDDSNVVWVIFDKNNNRVSTFTDEEDAKKHLEQLKATSKDKGYVIKKIRSGEPSGERRVHRAGFKMPDSDTDAKLRASVDKIAAKPKV